MGEKENSSPNIKMYKEVKGPSPPHMVIADGCRELLAGSRKTITYDYSPLIKYSTVMLSITMLPVVKGSRYTKNFMQIQKISWCINEFSYFSYSREMDL